jgi:hypothetical protein
MHDFQLRLAAPCRRVSVSTDLLCMGLLGSNGERIPALRFGRKHRGPFVIVRRTPFLPPAAWSRSI